MSKINFEPQGDFLLLETIPDNMTAGGIAIPDGANPNPTRARVIKAGPGRQNEEGNTVPMTIKEGDLVYMVIAYNQPQPITLNGRDFIIVRVRDVVGKCSEGQG